MNDLEADLDRLRAANLYRSRRLLDGPQGVRPIIDGRRVLSFNSNDYLGLASHPAVVDALKDGAGRYGVGSGAAHLVSGHSEAHRRLEQALAAFTGRPRALLFSTGYMANIGVIQALAGRDSRVFADKRNHASLTDGARMSQARLRRYPHGDSGRLARMLVGAGDALIVTDGVFSMDGDRAPLPALARAAREQGALLMVDDAHGLGVLGEAGRGTVDHYALGVDDVPILVGTLGKAFGTFGAFVAGSEPLIETLIQRARPYIYTTALPPAVAHATCVSLDIAVREEWRRKHLRELIGRFRDGARSLGLPLAESDTPIQPLIAGDAEVAMVWSRFLYDNGVLVSAIRPPTVPAGTARLRVTFCAEHKDGDVDHLLGLLGELPAEIKRGIHHE
ncbi:MAG: 8-amino-7-oxononanoate synthase [Thiohalocapsa sp.]